ncbi:MAG: molybdate ABC transporter substrate-binding protein [Dehalococcoidia bacterium]|nr:molybdate ABC transporter substrate-binding protein [Dehalococcoidia bacterium]
MKKIIVLISSTAIALLLITIGVAGCISQPQEVQSIMVYSGAGMRKPMDEIGLAFQEKYGTEVKYNYAGSNALLSQMELIGEGDVYMPGATMYIEVATEKGLVDYQQPVAYHIPIITVPKGNPGDIICLEDFARPGVKLVWGDPEAAAIGKTGKKILEKNGIYDVVWANVVATLPTMNEVMMQIALGQADASINWWDTVKSVEDIDCIEIPREQNIIKIIPIGVTTFSKTPETAREFVNFCASAEGKAIFDKHGFITYPNPKYES